MSLHSVLWDPVKVLRLQQMFTFVSSFKYTLDREDLQDSKAGWMEKNVNRPFIVDTVRSPQLCQWIFCLIQNNQTKYLDKCIN